MNCDEKTGIHYGVISQNTVMAEALVDMFSEYMKNLTYEQSLQFEKDSIKEQLDSLLIDDVELRDVLVMRANEYLDENFDYPPMPDDDFEYDDGAYHIINCLQNDLMIISSPYWTYAEQCSPCVPNAGNLDGATGNLKTYCLGPEWFEGEPPYEIYEVRGEGDE